MDERFDNERADRVRRLLSAARGFVIRQAVPDEAPELTRLAYAAKAYWGYPTEWLQRWREELTITTQYILAHATFVAAVNETAAGFCAVEFATDAAYLDHLWVRPDMMRRGIGRALFEHAERIASQGGARRLRIVGDPHAEAFYARMGAIKCGQQSARMDDQPRFLPVFEKPLPA